MTARGPNTPSRRPSGLTRVPDNVPLEQAAILADAVSTPFGAVVHTGKVAVGESVGVWGVGGVGTHIVQLARLVGAVPVIAVDINPVVRDRALELGADYAFDSRDPDFADKLAEATGGRKLDVAFDAVGLKVTFEQALDSLTVGGRLVGVGMSAESPTVGPTSMFGLTQRRCSATSATRTPTSRRWRSWCPAAGWICPVRSARSSRSRTSRTGSAFSSRPKATRSGCWCSRDTSRVAC